MISHIAGIQSHCDEWSSVQIRCIDRYLEVGVDFEADTRHLVWECVGREDGISSILGNKRVAN